MSRPDRPVRRLRAEVAPLEGRALLSITGFTAEASPTRLTPILPVNLPMPLPTGRFFIPVTLAGEVATTGTTPTIRYQVIDEKRRVEPSGSITPQLVAALPQKNFYIYKTRIGLVLHRNRHDPDGRQYLVQVTAQDQTGARTETIVVTAPRRTFPTLRHPRIIHVR